MKKILLLGLAMTLLACDAEVKKPAAVGSSGEQPSTPVAQPGGDSVEGKAFRIAIMQAKRGETQKYAPLLAYMQAKGLTIELVGTKNYNDAAAKFGSGKVDAMFSGSGVAGAMLIKELAIPLVRPQSKDGWSTYWAVVVAGSGSPAYSGAEFFQGKKIACCSLASSGEFFVRSQYEGRPLDCTLVRAASHGAAIQALAGGEADLAVIKNRVWDSMVADPAQAELLAGLEVIGRHEGQNPNGTLIVSTSVEPALRDRVKQALLGLKEDTSSVAQRLKDGMGVEAYLPTTRDDFKFTIPLLEKAGVTKEFHFTFDS